MSIDVHPDHPNTYKAFGALSIDTDEMHRLIGPTGVDWRDGMKRMLQTLAPQLLKA